MTGNALILSGRGRYADPWHPFEATSGRLSGLLGEFGFAVNVADDVDRSMASLDSLQPDLLVLNVGNPHESATADALTRGRRGLIAHVDAGRPILAMHSTATSMSHIPEFPGILGGLWVRGTSFHPPFGPVHVHVENDPNTTVSDFAVEDEAYSDLATLPGNRLIATHRLGRADHPLIWCRTYSTGSRVVYDALGHDAASYDSPSHIALLRGTVRWLTTTRP